MAVLISAVICTHNRAQHLGKAIQSLVYQGMAKNDYEIIVVDNCSTDTTKQVVGSFGRQENLRYIHEPTVGLSYARNAGWQGAKGKYVAYLDDDAIACKGWLQKIVEVFETVKPQPGCVGGRSEPIWEAPRPGWLSDWLLHGLAVIDWGKTPHPLEDLSAEWLIGANIAVPVSLLKNLGGFVAGLDRAGTHLLSSGDVFFEKEAAKRGYQCFYHPDIAIAHHIFKSRLEKSWFLRRYFWQGYSDAVMEILEHHASAVRRKQLALIRAVKLFRSPKRLRDLLSPTDDPDRFTQRCFALIEVGHVVGLLKGVQG